MCARHSLIQFKVLHRVHISKSKLAKMFPQTDPTFDRCKIKVATLIHMFGLGDCLKHYWESIFDALSTVLCVNIVPNPLIALFGIVLEELQLPVGEHNVIGTMLARRLILLKWKESEPPSVGLWIRDVISNLRLEKIRYIIRGSDQTFTRVWKSFYRTLTSQQHMHTCMLMCT